MLLQIGEIGVTDAVRGLGHLLDVTQGNLFFLAETGEAAILQGLPVVGSETGSLRRSEMMLGAVAALVEERDAQVNQFVEFAVERATDAGIKRQEGLKHVRTVGQRLLDIARLAFENLLVNF